LDEADPELVSPFIVWLSEKLSAFLSQPRPGWCGQGVSLVVPKKGSTWAAYWSGWQYLYTAPPGTRPLEQISGEPRQRGIGVFARFGFADKDTNPTEMGRQWRHRRAWPDPFTRQRLFWRGLLLQQHPDAQALRPAWNKRFDSGIECFYNIAITPAAHLTLDLQVVNSPQKRLKTATVLGLRATLEF
jgi:porin